MHDKGDLLVVDDSLVTLKLLTGVLTADGYQVRPADSGELALASVAAKRPELILLDIHMPGLDGFEVCRRLKARAESCDIPILFLSAATEGEDRLEALNLGGVDFIAKPFQPEELLARIRIHLELSRLRSQLALQAAELRLANEQLQIEIAERSSAEATLHREQEFNHTLLDNIADGVVACDAEGQLAMFNRAARQWHGLEAFRLPPVAWAAQYDLYGPDGVTPLSTEDIPLARALRGETIRDVGMTIVAKDQPPRHILASGGPFFDAHHNQLGAVVAMRDITERRHAEEEVRGLNADLERRVLQRTAELEAVNKELESFSYSVSHDLRAPLRGIDGWAQVLLEDYGEILGETGCQPLHRLRAASQRMAALIDDLLRLARMTRLPLVKQTISPEALVQRALTEVRLVNCSLPKEVVVGVLPECQADPSLLTQVFVNLLSNACKFSQDRLDARIEVGSQVGSDGQCLYFVKDNGVGFDMAHASKLFGAFQRLHDIREFPGTGIGLALTQRILHRHGGRIWAESAVGQGATFYFTLS